MVDPPHVGELIADEIKAKGLSVFATARALGASRTSFTRTLKGRQGLTPEMAIRLERVLGIGAELLMGMQAAYAVAQARRAHPGG